MNKLTLFKRNGAGKLRNIQVYKSGIVRIIFVGFTLEGVDSV